MCASLTVVENEHTVDLFKNCFLGKNQLGSGQYCMLYFDTSFEKRNDIGLIMLILE